MAVTDDAVRAELALIDDPEFGINLIEMGIVYGVEIQDDRVHLTMTLTSMGCPFGPFLHDEVTRRLTALEGVSEVEIDWVWDPPWSPEKMSEDGRFLMRVMGYNIGL